MKYSFDAFSAFRAITGNPTLALQVLEHISTTDDGVYEILSAYEFIAGKVARAIEKARQEATYVGAIKVIRAELDYGLKDAKDLVDSKIGRAHWGPVESLGI